MDGQALFYGPSRTGRGGGKERLDGFSGQDLLGVLQPNLAASTGSACASGIPEESHVLRAIGLTHDEASASIRFCVGRYTSDTDVHEAVDLISGALGRIAQLDA